MDRVKSESNVHEFTGLLSTQTQSRVYETYKNVVTGMDSLRTADAFPVVASLSQAKEWSLHAKIKGSRQKQGNSYLFGQSSDWLNALLIWLSETHGVGFILYCYITD